MTSLTQNWVKKHVHYVSTVIERSKSIFIQYLRIAIYFSGQFMNITKFWCLPISYFLFVTSLIPNRDKSISCTNGSKRIKITIYRNFEANIYRFHKFWNFNPSSDLITDKIKLNTTQICISSANGDKRINVIQKWNHSDISNTICGRKIKTSSTWTFRKNVFVKVIF